MGVRLTSIEIDSWITETDPIRLHHMATETCKNIKELERFKNTKEAAQIFNLMVNAASFLESRAVYFMLRRIMERN